VTSRQRSDVPLQMSTRKAIFVYFLLSCLKLGISLQIIE